MNESAPHDVPYEETAEGFAKWFRENAKDKWRDYLDGKERKITREEGDGMRAFLVEYGTQAEIETKLLSLIDARKIGAWDALKKEILLKRQDIKFN